MKRTVVLIALAVALASSSRADDAKRKPGQTSDYVKAEIRGTLKFDAGYVISVKPAADSNAEIRVWLWISEDKILVRQLEGLTGKLVVAKGDIHQMAANAKTAVPPLGLFLSQGEFTIEAAK